jgi:hypothetical protein
MTMTPGESNSASYFCPERQRKAMTAPINPEILLLRRQLAEAEQRIVFSRGILHSKEREHQFQLSERDAELEKLREALVKTRVQCVRGFQCAYDAEERVRYTTAIEVIDAALAATSATAEKKDSGEKT